MQGLTKLGGWLALVALFTATACMGGNTPRESTAEALALAIEQTRTVSAGVAAGAALETAEFEATRAAEDLNATSTALAEQSVLQLEATATAVAPIIAELPRYGVDPSEGNAAWIHPPISLSAQGPLAFEYRNNFLGTLVRDFVVSSDVTYNTTTGLAGCGFVLRSDGEDEAINQYMALVTRGGGGSIAFVKQKDGQFVNNQLQFAGAADPTFSPQNDATNRLTIVARGPSITFYTNGSRVREFSDDEFNLGFVAMVALSESGLTTCQFDNSWMWVLE